MTRLILVCGGWLALLGSAAAADPPASTPSAPIKEITIDPNVKEPACRRQAPTGSRIARERCEPPGTTASNAEREQLRRDLEEMRSREAMRDQARAAAELEALRRRAGL